MNAERSTFPHQRFWQALAAGKFVLPRCAACGAWQGPGAAACGRCKGPLAWTSASGEGTVFSTMERLPAEPNDGQLVVIAVVDLREGPRLLVTLQVRAVAGRTPASAVHVGAAVRVVRPSQPGADGLPRFALA